MAMQTRRPAGRHVAQTPDELSGVVMMLCLLAVFCVLAVLFV